MSKKQRYTILSGVILLIIAILVLGVSPGLIFSPTVTVIGTNLYKATSNQISVSTRADLNPQQLINIPKQIDKWQGVDYDSTATREALGANFVLMRGYEPNTFSQPLFLSVVQSRTDSSFHGPEACFTDQGYEIQESDTDSFPVIDQEWAKNNTALAIPCNRLVLVKRNSEGKIYERSVVLYFYVKGNQFYSDHVTMFEIQGLCPIEGSYEGTLSEQKNFLSQIVPVIFSPSNSNTNQSVKPLFATLTDYGSIGYLCIALIILIPLGLIVFPFLRR